MSNPHQAQIASDVLGTFGAVFWSIQLIPQIVLNATRPEKTKGLQPSMMLLWAAAGVPLGVYNILSGKNIALQIQPQILISLSLITWSQVMYYGHRWSLVKAVAVVIALGLLAAGIESSVIFGLQARYDGRENVPRAVLVILAALAAAGLALGVLRHYVDIYTHRSVRGISFIFVALDAAGDVTSLASVGACATLTPRPSLDSIAIVKPLDIEGSVIYAVELLLWMGIMLAGVAFNLRAWLRRRRTSPALGDAALARSDSASSVFQTSSAAISRHELRQRHTVDSVEL